MYIKMTCRKCERLNQMAAWWEQIVRNMEHEVKQEGGISRKQLEKARISWAYCRGMQHEHRHFHLYSQDVLCWKNPKRRRSSRHARHRSDSGVFCD